MNIVEELRKNAGQCGCDECCQRRAAADEIERLRDVLTWSEQNCPGKCAGPIRAALSPPEPTEGQKYDDPMFNKGVQHVVDLLAKTCGVTDWEAGDGSEDYDDDLSVTLLNILAAKGLFDREEWAFRSMPLQDHSEPKPPKMRAETTPEMWDLARRLVLEKPSTSYIQRKLMIGYNHACEIMEHFEAQGLVSASRADGTRVILAEQQTEAK